MDPDASIPTEPAPSVFNYVLSFLLVGVAWGFTTPFIRRAAADFNARQEKASGSDTSASARGRSRSQGEEGEEEQELLAPGEQEVRRRSGSRQRAEEEDGSARQLNAELGDVDADEVDNAPRPAWMRSPSGSGSGSGSWVKRKIVSIFWTVVNLLRTPAYSIPLVINLTGSIWFFLLVGKHGMFISESLLVLSWYMRYWIGLGVQGC